MTDSNEKVCNVKVAYIRPKFKNLKEWCENENNIYIARKGIVFIKEGDKKERYPKQSSKWANPFKINKDCTREQCLMRYKEYIENKIFEEPDRYDLNELRNKNLGCWCYPEKCHGNILIDLLEKKI